MDEWSKENLPWVVQFLPSFVNMWKKIVFLRYVYICYSQTLWFDSSTGISWPLTPCRVTHNLANNNCTLFMASKLMSPFWEHSQDGHCSATCFHHVPIASALLMESCHGRCGLHCGLDYSVTSTVARWTLLCDVNPSQTIVSMLSRADQSKVWCLGDGREQWLCIMSSLNPSYHSTPIDGGSSVWLLSLPVISPSTCATRAAPCHLHRPWPQEDS